MKRFPTTVLFLAITAATGFSAFAAAEDYYGNRSYDSRYDYRYDTYRASDYRNSNSRRDIATVVRVDERYANNGYLRQECWNERTNGYESGYYRDSNGRLYRGDSTTNGTLLGALIGGALGNQVGDGNGRTAATIAGAVIGGKVGHDIDARNDSNGSAYEYRDQSGITRRCRTVSDGGGRFGGYDVTYRYAGQSYHALMNYRPGRTIRVMVDVRPMFEGMASRY
jgi:outer membrane lipoprotein SlyB